MGSKTVPAFLPGFLRYLVGETQDGTQPRFYLVGFRRIA
jgi:hypothetical protein